ncbi:MAG: glycosyltransferase [Phycisphaerae bacterium]|nr:glycosyltransferase [Phycisphaerae bacterium]
MRILMLGWEFPPFIAGGLGTACYGLTKALDRLGQEVLFVLPRPVDRSAASHITLLSPDSESPTASGEGWRGGETGATRSSTASESERAGGVGADGDGGDSVGADGPRSAVGMPGVAPGFRRARLLGVPARFRSPYGAGGAVGGRARRAGSAIEGAAVAGAESGLVGTAGEDELGDWDDGTESGAGSGGGSWVVQSGAGHGYMGDLVGDAERYARLCVGLTRGRRFDVIHAHDWLTYPAGIALARASGKPLVVHVHSTEFDRSGEHVNQRVYDIERRGMLSALRVIAVSNLTRSICVGRYGIDPSRIEVVYNGIDSASAQPADGTSIRTRDRIVLFLGRITMQKGPEYFIRAAKRVLEKVPDAKFVVAGSGDMAVRMIEEAAALGIGHRVLFAGFLRGPQVDRIYRMADCYVMPSVSEPFGIAPLEAMRNDVPVIISKQSGVSEVLTHALKVDFWDIDEMANKIVAVLRHPPLGRTMREHGSFELRKLTWEGAATKCVQVYRQAIDAQRLGRSRSA